MSKPFPNGLAFWLLYGGIVEEYLKERRCAGHAQQLEYVRKKVIALVDAETDGALLEQLQRFAVAADANLTDEPGGRVLH